MVLHGQLGQWASSHVLPAAVRVKGEVLADGS